MDKEKLIVKELCGHRYAVLSSEGAAALIDTVPAEFADRWLASAPDAEVLILCGANPYPRCVESFIKAHPQGKIYAAPYVAHTLAGILGESFSCTWLRDNASVKVGGCKLTFTAVTRAGKGAYLIAEAGPAGRYSGGEQQTDIAPVVYDRPTVVIAYVSGCDYTEVIAEKIALGIQDSEGLDVRLWDLASAPAEAVLAAMVNASGVLIGTPTVDNDAHPRVWELLTGMGGKGFKGKFASAFGAYTHSGEAVPHVVERLRQLKLVLPDGGFTLQYQPGESGLTAAYEYGYYYGCKLQGKPDTHRTGLVKCLVCGEIFEASLGVCPVCNVGLDKCVPVEDEFVGYAADTDRTYLIAGGGTAALSAAQAIRKRDRTGRIIMVSAEDCLPINRPMLSKNMPVAARVKDSVTVRRAEWFTENGVEVCLNTRVNAIDPVKKTVVLSNGRAIAYDKLIYAMGAECFVPNLPGKDLDGVLSIRHLKDVHQLWQRLPKAKSAVVIGGGVLGLEVAAELKKMRLSVTVLEMAPKIMARQLDDDSALKLTDAADRCGVKIVTGADIARIAGSTDVTGVMLADGTVYPAQIVIMSCGNRASTDVARNAGISCGRAVTVTERMETSVPDIYACGDCAELDGVNYQLWAEASEQGRVAGANAAGDRVKYEPVPYGAAFEGFNTKLFAIGDTGGGWGEYRLVEYRDEIDGSCRRYWFSGQQLCGGVLYGNTDNMAALTEGITKGSTYTQLRGRL